MFIFLDTKKAELTLNDSDQSAVTVVAITMGSDHSAQLILTSLKCRIIKNLSKMVHQLAKLIKTVEQLTKIKEISDIIPHKPWLSNSSDLNPFE